MIPNQTVIVTGGNQGLGFECVRNLARDGRWQVVIASRDQKRTEMAAQQLRYEMAFPHIYASVLDLASLDSIRQFVRQFSTQQLPPLRAMVCNAGVQIMNGTQYTADGFEMTFGVNHLGHFLLVNLLLSQLVAPARIVIVSSGTHDPETLDGRIVPASYTSAHELAKPHSIKEGVQDYRLGMERYVTSKLCNLFFAYELHRRLQTSDFTGITVNAYDPGAVPGTGLTREYEGGLSLGIRFLGYLQPVFERLGMNIHTVESSGAAMARLVIDPQLATVSGKYFQWKNERLSSRDSYDLGKAARLWDDSLNLVQLTGDETPFKLTTDATALQS